MAKWPNVPHCYGWLALDARGNWRMRDEAAQRAGASGDRLTNPALVGFINRNYQRDERGCWYFQNGPQRVFVNLEATPFIARTDPRQGLMLHTGQLMPAIERVFLTETGQAIVQGREAVAQLDDRDMAQWLGTLRLDGQAVPDDALMAWLEGGAGKLVLPYKGQAIAVEHIDSGKVEQRFGFNRTPVL